MWLKPMNTGVVSHSALDNTPAHSPNSRRPSTKITQPIASPSANETRRARNSTR